MKSSSLGELHGPLRRFADYTPMWILRTAQLGSAGATATLPTRRNWFWQSLSERPNISNPSKTKSESAVMSDQSNVIDRFLRTGDSLWSATPIPEVRLQLVEVHVVDGRDVERHDLREEQPTHHG